MTIVIRSSGVIIMLASNGSNIINNIIRFRSIVTDTILLIIATSMSISSSSSSDNSDSSSGSMRAASVAIINVTGSGVDTAIALSSVPLRMRGWLSMITMRTRIASTPRRHYDHRHCKSYRHDQYEQHGNYHQLYE